MTTSVVVNEKGMGQIDKDPQAVLDYIYDWSAWLAGIFDTIVSATFPVANGGTTVNSFDIINIAPGSANGVRAWIGGGTLDEIAEVTCRITTQGGRTEERTLRLKIRER